MLGNHRLCRNAIQVAALALMLVAFRNAPADPAAVPADVASSPSGELDEVVVTARKREETILNAPVIMEVVSAKEIQDLRINDLTQLSTITPDLNIGPGFSTVGTYVNLRGISNSTAAVFIDQSVQLNIDGASTSTGQFYRTGLFDVDQIQVLKGPQALFFGKSASAGIIAVRSADPTKDWETKVTAGYEFEAGEIPIDAYISGPLTDNLGIRIAGYYSHMDGYIRNPNPAIDGSDFPDGHDAGGRVTLKYDNASNFRAKLKFSYGETKSNGYEGEINEILCSGSHPQLSNYMYANCRINGVATGSPPATPYNPNLNYSYGNAAAFAAGNPINLFGDGQPYENTETFFSVLDLDYDIMPKLTLSSVTAYMGATADDSGNSFSPPGPGTEVELAGYSVNRDWSEELRLTSNYDSWINFMVGGVYDWVRAKDTLGLNIPAATFYTDDTDETVTTTTSGFGQILLTPIKQWEFSAGVRYTHVEKDAPLLDVVSNVAASGNQEGLVPYSVTHFSENNASPEFTLSYKPTDDLTAFVSYKRGYKGPGYSIDAVSTNYAAPGEIYPFGGEHVLGEEGGVKAALFDRQLFLTASVYNYKFNDVQVAFSNQILHEVQVEPDADIRTKGIEATADYRPQIVNGLTLRAALNYNDAYYTSFQGAPCYGGETLAEGCVNNAHNLAGLRVNNAPLWAGNVGAEYRVAIGKTYTLAVNPNASFSGPYNFTPEQNPISIQGGYMTLDLATHFGPSNGSWELALITRDLTNRYVLEVGQDIGTVIPGVVGDVQGVPLRPRQILLEFTVRPNLL